MSSEPDIKPLISEAVSVGEQVGVDSSDFSVRLPVTVTGSDCDSAVTLIFPEPSLEELRQRENEFIDNASAPATSRVRRYQASRARQIGCPDARNNQKIGLGNQILEASCPGGNQHFCQTFEV